MKPIKQYLTVSIWALGDGTLAVRGYYRGASHLIAHCASLTEALPIAFATPRKQDSIALVPLAGRAAGDFAFGPLTGLKEVITTPASGTRPSQQNNAEMVVTPGETDLGSTAPARGAITHECVSITEMDRLRNIEADYDTPVQIAAIERLETPADLPHAVAWQPISKAPALERVIVAGWQPITGRVNRAGFAGGSNS